MTWCGIQRDVELCADGFPIQNKHCGVKKRDEFWQCDKEK